jgi:hypothetical protein
MTFARNHAFVSCSCCWRQISLHPKIYNQLSSDFVEEIESTSGVFSGVATFSSIIAAILLGLEGITMIHELYLLLVFFSRKRGHVVESAHPSYGDWSWQRTGWEFKAKVILKGNCILLKFFFLE